MLKVGIQLYSVRDDMVNNPLETLKALADMGYKYLEVANATVDETPGIGFGVKSDDLLKTLEPFGSKVIGGHYRPINDETLPDIIAFNKSIGNKYIGQSADFYTSYENLLERCEYYNNVGKECAKEGMMFIVHNHAHEFQKIDGKYVMYHIMENTNPEYVGFEVDTFWVMRGGADPVEVLKTMGNRVKLVHQKDFSKTTESKINVIEDLDPTVFITREMAFGNINPLDFTEIGTGIMDIQKIIDAANEIGAEYIILEQDHTQLERIESVKRSMENFKKFTGIEWE